MKTASECYDEIVHKYTSGAYSYFILRKEFAVEAMELYADQFNKNNEA